MSRILSNLTLLFLFISLTTYAQYKPSAANKFFNFLNAYQKDSLQNILTADFHLNRTYTSYSNDKTSFLNKYLLNSKAFNGKFKILYCINEMEPQQFLVEDQSDYLTYLHVAYPTWKFTICTEHELIKLATIDTTEMYQKYLTEIKIANEKFEAWLKIKYPKDTLDELYNQEGLLTKRLEQYAKRKK